MSDALILSEVAVSGFCARDFMPFGTVVVGELGVAVDVAVDVGDEEGVGEGQCLVVNFGAADDEDGRVAGSFECGVEAGKTFDAGDGGTAGEDDVAAAGEGFADGVVGLTSHDEGVAHGDSFEMLEVFTQMPGKTALVTDGAVGSDGGDDDDVHTATLNLIFGCGL